MSRSYTKDKFDRLWRLIDDEQFVLANAVMEELAGSVGSKHPDLIRASQLIQFLLRPYDE